MRRTLVLSLLLLLGACSTTSGASAEEEGGKAWAGERLYRKRCASCHRLRDPSEQTGEGWVEVMRRMAPRAHLSGDEAEVVLGWLRSQARGAPPR